MRYAFLVVAFSCCAQVSAQPSSGGGFYLEPVVPDGSIGFPTSVVAAPTGELYVAKWLGDVKVILPGGELVDEPLVNLYGEVLVNGDRGMVGITLHPDFPATPYIYLFFPVDDLPNPPESRFRAYSRLVRYTVDETRRSVVPGSRRVLLGATPADGITSCYNSHSADSIVFGHDGALYVSHGDGASWLEADGGGLYPECFDGTGIDPAEDIGAFRAQSLQSLSGKVLRLDPETGLGLPDNPFWTGDGADPASKVWSMGLRNPFRLAVVPEDPDNPGQTEIVIGDVGSGLFEELNRARGGENFGWPCLEGPSPNPAYLNLTVTDGTDCSTSRPGTLSAPWAYFSHLDPAASAPSGRIAFSITGGAFYSGDTYPERFDEMLFFADYSEGWITAGRLGPDGLLDPEEVLGEAGSIVDLSYDPVTETILTVDIVNQRIARLRWAGDAAAPPVARGTVANPFGQVPHTAQFADDGSFDPAGGTLTYQWSFGDGGSAVGPDVSHTYDRAGIYAATLTVTSSSGQVAQSVVRVSVGESLPAVSILDETPYVMDPTGRIRLAAIASDDRDEVLDVFWEVDLIHNSHLHPSFGTIDGLTGTFIAESHAGPGEVAFYGARAVVVDQEGLRVEKRRTIRTYDAAEIGVVPGEETVAAPMTVTFSHPVEIGRVGLPQFGAYVALDVEVLDDSGWRPARFPYTLPEGRNMNVIFVNETVRGVRVSGAPSLTGPFVAYPRLTPDEELGAWDPADAGSSRPGRTNRFGESGLVLAGDGSFEDGAYHTARQPLTGDGLLVARLDALDGEDEAVGGLAMHTGLDADATGIAIGRSPDGRVRTWSRVSGVVTESPVSIERAEWFRIRRHNGRLVADASRDSLTWIFGGEVYSSTSEAHVAGPMVAGGEHRALAWFDSVDLHQGSGGVETPSVGSFVVEPLFPNPGRGLATFRVAAGLPGTYSAEVVDTRGRVVLTVEPHVVVEPETFRMSFPRDELSQGTYYVRVWNTDLGLSRRIQFVTIR